MTEQYGLDALRNLLTVVESGKGFRARAGGGGRRRRGTYWTDPVLFIQHVSMNLGFVGVRGDATQVECIDCDLRLELVDLVGQRQHQKSHLVVTDYDRALLDLRRREARDVERINALDLHELDSGTFDVKLAMTRLAKHVVEYQVKRAHLNANQ